MVHRFLRMMRLKPFVIFDTEFTAWENSIKTNWNDQKEPMELIQIGMIKFQNIPKNTTSLNELIIDSKEILTKQTLVHKLSQYIQDLTGISQERIDKEGISLRKALEDFKEFCGDSIVFSYGHDREIMWANLKYIKDKDFVNEYSHFLNESFFDIRDLFGYYGIDTYKYSSGTVHKAIGIDKNKVPFEKQNIFDLSTGIDVHNALWDVSSIARTLEGIAFII